MFNRNQLESWAGTGAFQRGVAYFRQGKVVAPTFSDSTVEATVMGSHPYQVLLRWRGDFLHADCDCPVGERGDFCKHCVAVSLAWLERGSHTAGPSDEADRLRQWLKGQSRDELVEQIIDLAEKHDDLQRELMLKATAGALDLKAMKQTIRKTIGNRFVDYHEMPAYVRRLFEVTTMLEQLLADGHATEVQALSAYAIERLGKALLKIDDSDGGAGAELDHWQELHLKAWRMQPPADDKGRRRLARDLFSRWRAAEWDEFAHAPEIYADILGAAGTDTFRRLVQKEWEDLPRLEPGDERRSFDASRSKITAMMESSARADGDVDAMIRIKSHDLSMPFHFLELAETCRTAGRDDEALAWAEQGVAAFPDSRDSRLEEFLIDEYVRHGQYAKALTRAWGLFERQPSLTAWQRLKKQALLSGEWPEWKPWMLDFLRDRIARNRQGRKPAHGFDFRPGGSLLVEILLDENEPEQALREAEVHGCHERQQERLAMAFGDHDPKQAAACLRPLVEPMIRMTNNNAYEQAVAWLKTMGLWMHVSGEQHAFDAWVTELASRYKAKRNFVKLLRRHHLID